MIIPVPKTLTICDKGEKLASFGNCSTQLLRIQTLKVMINFVDVNLKISKKNWPNRRLSSN
jgi:hypothetical protein